MTDEQGPCPSLRSPSPPHILFLPLHDALPIFPAPGPARDRAPAQRTRAVSRARPGRPRPRRPPRPPRAEEHTSDLQSLTQLVWRLLLDNKKTIRRTGGVAVNCVTTFASNTEDF